MSTFRRFRRGGPAGVPTHLQRLHEFGRFVALTQDPGELYTGVAARLRDIFGLEWIAVFAREGDDPSFRMVAARGTGHSGVAFALDGRLARWLRVNETLLVPAASPGVMSFLAVDEREALERMGAERCVPLIALNQLIGLLVLGPRSPGQSGVEEDPDLLTALAGQAALAFGTVALLSERKARLKTMYRAERLATAGELAAGAAHEIRNPLAAIRSAIQYLRRGHPDGGEEAELMGDLLSEVDRIDGIVGGLLAFARPEDAHLERVELAELIRQSLALVAVRARDQGVAVVQELPDPLPLTADAGQMKQVFLNLFLNALQATGPGGELRVWAAARAGGVEVRVSDTGQGIAPEHLERIFDPFFTTRPEGTGLGLSICYGIVQRHGGEVQARSEPGRGTTITIRMPQR